MQCGTQLESIRETERDWVRIGNFATYFDSEKGDCFFGVAAIRV